MTKIDPTPLIAEAQARETALQVALERLQTVYAYTWPVVFLCGWVVGVAMSFFWLVKL